MLNTRRLVLKKQIILFVDGWAEYGFDQQALILYVSFEKFLVRY